MILSAEKGKLKNVWHMKELSSQRTHDQYLWVRHYIAWGEASVVPNSLSL